MNKEVRLKRSFLVLYSSFVFLGCGFISDFVFTNIVSEKTLVRNPFRYSAKIPLKSL